MAREKLKAAIIVDAMYISRWQAAALKLCEDSLDIRLVLNCRNNRTKKHIGRHFLYYCLNILCMRSASTKGVKMASETAKILTFNAYQDKLWQSIPIEIVEEAQKKEIDIVIKFGMGLFRNHAALGAKYGVLSFHHGDPEEYRGRPAGFYEVLANAPKMGVIIQQLGDALDGGKIVASRYTKITHYSYAKTLQHAYESSSDLLRKAIENICNNRFVENSGKGRNYRLPSNLVVAKFIIILLVRKIRRILYGLTIEKHWKVAINQVKIDQMPVVPLEVNDKNTLPIDKKYTFYADPFFSESGKKIYLEALNARTGQGNIIAIDIDDTGEYIPLLKGDHFSYPQALAHDGKQYLIPEVASWSDPRLYKFTGDALISSDVLKAWDHGRMVDLTHFYHDEWHFLFGSPASSPADNLFLFYSKDLGGPYKSHPMNPIVCDPECSRMAGAIVVKGDKMYRLGQNNSYRYGDGITVSSITLINSNTYEETRHSSFSLDSVQGPHTVNSLGGRTVFDFYSEKFSFLAGYRRLLPKILEKIQ